MIAAAPDEAGQPVQDDLAEELRAWARGLYPCEAAVEVLIRSGMHHRLDGYPDVMGRPDEYRWVHWDALVAVADNGPWSGGERRLLLAAAALSGEVAVRVDLTGLNEPWTLLVLHAVAHTGGWHERGTTARIDGTFTTPTTTGAGEPR
jgi:hypothetical protein